MSGLRMDLLEEEGILERKCKGMGLITCGKLLLWIDLMLVLTFLMPGLRDGSSLWTWWIVAEAAVGLALIGAGLHFRGTVYE